MALDLAGIARAVKAAPLVSPYPYELSMAVVNDCFRLAGHVPPPCAAWSKWAAKNAGRPLVVEQAGMLAHILAVSALREESVASLGGRSFDPEPALGRFFEAIGPLTAEMIRANAFRQEEFLRRWAETVGAAIAGESAGASRQRLAQLDYRKTLAEYARADRARQAEAERRAKLLQEAAQREAEARGWRE